MINNAIVFNIFIENKRGKEMSDKDIKELKKRGYDLDKLGVDKSKRRKAKDPLMIIIYLLIPQAIYFTISLIILLFAFYT